MTRLLALSACLSTACLEPQWAWEPGDGPLRYEADNAAAEELFLAGCATWAEVGLTCEPGTGDDAVRISWGDLPGTTLGYSERWCGASVWTWDHSVTFDVFLLSKMAGDEAQVRQAHRTAAHEVGHLLGIWEHTPDNAGAALMTGPPSADGPTELDLARLP